MGQGVNFNAGGGGGGALQLNAFQNATIGAVNQAIKNGNLTAAQKQQLQTDLQAVQQAEASGDPQKLHAAMHKLREDAKADNVQGLPKGNGGKGKGGGDDQMVTVTDPATGQTYQVPASQAASFSSGGGGNNLFAGNTGSTFGYNGANSMFGGDGFSRT